MMTDSEGGLWREMGTFFIILQCCPRRGAQYMLGIMLFPRTSFLLVFKGCLKRKQLQFAITEVLADFPAGGIPGLGLITCAGSCRCSPGLPRQTLGSSGWHPPQKAGPPPWHTPAGSHSGQSVGPASAGAVPPAREVKLTVIPMCEALDMFLQWQKQRGCPESGHVYTVNSWSSREDVGGNRHPVKILSLEKHCIITCLELPRVSCISIF